MKNTCDFRRKEVTITNTMPVSGTVPATGAPRGGLYRSRHYLKKTQGGFVC